MYLKFSYFFHRIEKKFINRDRKIVYINFFSILIMYYVDMLQAKNLEKFVI